MSRVLCVGQLAADILVRPVDRLDFASDTRRVEPIRLSNGGDCLNAAIGLRRLGLSVDFAGLVGQDQWGDFLASVIEREGIDGRGLKRTGQAGTCTVLVAINSQGERTFFYHGGANDLFSLRRRGSGPGGRGGCGARGRHLPPAPFRRRRRGELFRSARAQGKLATMDVTWDVEGRWLSTIAPCLPHLSWFLPSVKRPRRSPAAPSPRTWPPSCATGAWPTS